MCRILNLCASSNLCATPFINDCAKLIANGLHKFGIDAETLNAEGFSPKNYINFLFDTEMYDKYGWSQAYNEFYDYFAEQCYNTLSMSQKEVDEYNSALNNGGEPYSEDEIVGAIIYNDPELGIDMVSNGLLADYLAEYI